MKVTEKFISIDGEGKRSGEVSAFIRLAGCNLNCSYCDTSYSSKATDGKEESVDSIVAWLRSQKCTVRNVTVTGGEPLIHHGIDLLLFSLLFNGYDVNVETNGSVLVEKIREEVRAIWSSDRLVMFPREKLSFTVDYKCPSSDMQSEMDDRNFDKFALSPQDCIKFVVGDKQDLHVALLMRQRVNKDIMFFISPVWGKIDPKDIVSFMLERNASLPNTRLQLQLHKIIWNPSERGV